MEVEGNYLWKGVGLRKMREDGLKGSEGMEREQNVTRLYENRTMKLIACITNI